MANQKNGKTGKTKKNEDFLFMRIFRYYNKKGLYLWAALLCILCGVSTMILNVLMGEMANLLTHDQVDNFKKEAKDYVVQVAIYCACYTVVLFLKDWATGYVGCYFLKNIRVCLFRRLISLDISYYDENSAGVLMNKFTADCSTLNEVYINKLFQTIVNVSMAVSGFICAFVYCWQAVLAVVIGFPLAAVAYCVTKRYLDKLYKGFDRQSQAANAKAEQVISYFRTVKAFDNEILEADKYKGHLEEIEKIHKKASIAIAIKEAIILFLVNAMLIGFLYFAAWIVVYKGWNLKTGELLVVVASIIFTAIGVQAALTLTEDFDRVVISARRILDVLETDIDVDQREGKYPEEAIHGKIEFRDVSFKYPTTEQYAIEDLSFVVEAGQTVAFVGESGCGKSTTLQLLQRFYEIEKGEILIDDVDIKKLSPHYLRSQIAIVPQSPVLFSMSIKDNIRFGKPDASTKEVSDASMTAQAHEFIMGLDDNYKTQVETTKLSGGQKQRICIARAVILRSPILLLDEATASLDSESEKLVQDALDEVREGKTAIIVAHRLATVMNADRIFVFKEGHIVEHGTHQELQAKNGYYAELIKYQIQ